MRLEDPTVNRRVLAHDGPRADPRNLLGLGGLGDVEDGQAQPTEYVGVAARGQTRGGRLQKEVVVQMRSERAARPCERVA